MDVSSPNDPRHRLSAEVFIEILSYLRGDTDTLLACSLASPSLLGPSRTQLFHTVTIIDVKRPGQTLFREFSTFMASATHLACLVRVLSLRGAPWLSPSQLPRMSLDLLASVVRHLTVLQTLELKNVEWDGAVGSHEDVAASLSMPTLQRLELLPSFWSKNSWWTFDILPCAPRIKVLKIAGGQFPRPEEALEQRSGQPLIPDGADLETFIFDNFAFPSVSFILALAQSIPRLHHVHSLGIVVDLQADVRPIGEFLSLVGPTLKRLSLKVLQTSWSGDIEDACRTLSLDRCVSLQKLYIWIYRDGCNYHRDTLRFIPLLLAQISRKVELKEILCILPTLAPRHKYQMDQSLPWDLLQSILCQMPHLTLFRVLQNARTPRENDESTDATPQVRKWVMSNLPRLAASGILHFR